MTPEYWQKIDQLFQAAIELRPEQRSSFLEEACAGDENLRSEVEALIASDDHGLSFIEDPAFEMGANLLVSNKPELPEGHQLGDYKILSLLGKGGMGEVYLAEDTELGRRIAIKLLPAEFTRDGERLRRFRQEARAASALNHPNILTIHQISQVDGRYLIATEFVDGETLRQRMRRASLTLGEVVDIAIQVCSALAAAHEAGIVHRDIKPENIMLRRDGYLKVLDFGLAKLTEQHEAKIQAGIHAGIAENVNISSGLVMGTVKYMSPEQARGQSVDPRSDIFSLGVVLYEMLAGRTPFEGVTSSELISALLKKEPAPLINVPDEMQRLVTRSLQKKKEDRYQTIQSLLVDLRRLADTKGVANTARLNLAITDGSELSTIPATPLSTASTIESIVSGIRRYKTSAAMVLILFVLSATAIGYALYLKLSNSSFTTSATNVRLSRLTATGKAFNAAISPDGQYVAFVTSEANKPDLGQEALWLRNVAANTNIQIFPPSGHHYSGLTFSHDGKYLYYMASDKDDPEPALYQTPVAGGGTPRKVLTGAINPQTSGAISFSPDSNRLVFVRQYPSDETAIVTANADGSDERKIASRQGDSSFAKAAWSPDGQRMACVGVKQDSKGSYYELIEMDAQGGSEKPISPQRWNWIDDVVWLSDGSGLLITAVDEEGASFQIWEVTYPAGNARNLTTDFVSGYSGLSLTKDSSVLVTTRNETIQNIWTQPAGDGSNAKQITTGAAGDGGDGMAWTPDGRIVYSSFANGHLDIWIMDADGSNQRQLTANLGSAYFGVSVSGDGRYIAFVSKQAGHAHIWRVNIDGTEPKQLTNGSGELNPVFLPDDWLGYPCEISGKKARCKVPIDGGDTVQVTAPYSDMMRFSPDGRLIAYIPADGQDKGKRIGVVRVDSSEPARIFDLPPSAMPRRMQWSADSRALTYIDTRRGISNLWRLPLDGGKAVQLTDFRDQFIPSFAWSRDGTQLALARSTMANDVVLMRNFR